MVLHEVERIIFLVSMIVMGRICLIYLGWSYRRIGHELGRHPSTIARELLRSGNMKSQVYAAKSAQEASLEACAATFIE
ncbi:hypothetical protein FHS16_006001 [Paenibacillus endophyticus]|uniref:Transposase IS30-like HTH domain-containing protein n=3 Tax=Paenibacillus endophyticus TaxID=1294268 RepID=A0A7W5CDW8_9BACL|nr:hypothetical protein [Paenibacillus endophyticus]